MTDQETLPAQAQTDLRGQETMLPGAADDDMRGQETMPPGAANTSIATAARRSSSGLSARMTPRLAEGSFVGCGQ